MTRRHVSRGPLRGGALRGGPVRGPTLPVAAAAAAVALILATPAPALASVPGWRGSGLTGLQLLGIYVGGPLGLFLLIALLFVLLPAWASGSRHRSKLMWTAEPAWFGGPAGGQGALQVTEPSDDGGGASASW